MEESCKTSKLGVRNCTHTHSITIIGNIVHEPWSRYYRTNTYVFMKVTAYMARGVQTIC